MFDASTTWLLVKNGRYLVEYVAGWGIEAMWSFCRTDKNVLPLPGVEHDTFEFYEWSVSCRTVVMRLSHGIRRRVRRDTSDRGTARKVVWASGSV